MTYSRAQEPPAEPLATRIGPRSAGRHIAKYLEGELPLGVGAKPDFGSLRRPMKRMILAMTAVMALACEARRHWRRFVQVRARGARAPASAAARPEPNASICSSVATPPSCGYADGVRRAALGKLIWHLYGAASPAAGIYYDQRTPTAWRCAICRRCVASGGVDPALQIHHYTKLFWINSSPYNNLTARKFVLKYAGSVFAAKAAVAPAPSSLKTARRSTSCSRA